jgi:AraC-like DNA-binding protein
MSKRFAAENRIWIEIALNDFLRSHPPAQEGIPGEIREVLRHIHHSLFEQKLNVRYLKCCCRIRDNNISSRFRYAMGITIKQYVEGLRMEAASHLLNRELIGILDVAISVGYENLQTFYRVFSRYYGCTPGNYRSHGFPHLGQPLKSRIELVTESRV